MNRQSTPLLTLLVTSLCLTLMIGSQLFAQQNDALKLLKGGAKSAGDDKQIEQLADSELERMLNKLGHAVSKPVQKTDAQTLYKFQASSRNVVVVNQRAKQRVMVFASIDGTKLNVVEMKQGANKWNSGDHVSTTFVDKDGDWIVQGDFKLAGGVKEAEVAKFFQAYFAEVASFPASPNAHATSGETTPPARPNTSATVDRARLPQPTSFTLQQLTPLRDAARKTGEFPEGAFERVPEGWSKGTLDPHKALAVFKTLKLKQGFQLRTYQYREDLNGNGVVWALPAGAAFPDPAELVKDRFELLKPPKPPKAYDNYMEAIEGDRSALSFVSASLLRRELGDFGSVWHGAGWVFHTLLDSSPWDESAKQPEWFPEPPSPLSDWKWMKPKPTDWKPKVSVKGQVVTVTFYTYSPIEKESIYRHVDEYRVGEYRFSSEMQKLAIGSKGVLP